MESQFSQLVVGGRVQIGVNIAIQSSEMARKVEGQKFSLHRAFVGQIAFRSTCGRKRNCLDGK